MQSRRAMRWDDRASAESIQQKETRPQAVRRAPRPRPPLRYEWDERRTTARQPRRWYFLREWTRATPATKCKAARSRLRAGGDSAGGIRTVWARQASNSARAWRTGPDETRCCPGWPRTAGAGKV